jgi:hypothetical protein
VSARRRRPFRRTALVLGLICLAEAGSFAVGAASAAFPGSGLARFTSIKRGS